jgi:hypothetical protein
MEFIKALLASGIDKNRQNDLYHRMTHNAQRTNAAAQKVRQTEEGESLMQQIADEKASRKASLSRQRELEAQRKGLGSSKSRPRGVATKDKAGSSSSGRVKTKSKHRVNQGLSNVTPVKYSANETGSSIPAVTNSQSVKGTR